MDGNHINRRVIYIRLILEGNGELHQQRINNDEGYPYYQRITEQCVQDIDCPASHLLDSVMLSFFTDSLRGLHAVSSFA
ncbi:hypothetical protein D3C76_1792950 [compost metagenome]